MKAPFLNPNKIAGVVSAATIFASQLFAPAPLNAAVPMMYETANDIPPELFQNRAFIHGRVVKVIDGDTIRIRHYPLYPYQNQNEYNGKLSEHTITIRLYGIDAPEIGKNGNPPMAYANEARDYTLSKVDGKIVNVKLLRKDQYQRVVGKVLTDECFPVTSFSRSGISGGSVSNNAGSAGFGSSSSFSSSSVCKPNSDYLDLSLGLAHNGYSLLYKGGGAEYDGSKNDLEHEIQFAQGKRLGVWTNGVENVQTPAEYKKAIREKSQ